MRHNIPAELRQLAQWCVCGPDKVPLHPRTGRAASVSDPSTWGSFDEANKSAYPNIGFVFTEADPFTIIDLDNKPDRPCTPEQLARHHKILDSFVTYTERSLSGRGYHIIMRGRAPASLHRDNVEVYSTGRFMVCTGDVVRDTPIVDCQALLEVLCAEMTPRLSIELIEEDETMCDRDLVEMASNAVNGDKYVALCNGDWRAMGYPSQSEADFALLSMLAFYTRSNAQVRRLFRFSALGKRDKACRNDAYLDRALAKIRAEEPPPVDLSTFRVNGHAQGAPGYEVGATAGGAPQNAPESPPGGFNAPSLGFPEAPTPHPNGKELSLPPGLIGDLAVYFYQQAVRPVKDVALAAAIGVTAGVCGRSYNVSGTGLHQYLILVASTGSGKDGAASGIDNLISAVRPSIPMVDQFMGPAAFASGQALIKVLDERPCFCSVLGEFGLTLQQICDPRQGNGALLMLRRVMLDLYSKSGWNRILKSSVYSDTEKNTKTIQAPNVTILGETTPETLFSGLDSSYITDGLIPRFCVIQYQGDRPPRNPYAGAPPPRPLVDRFIELVAVSLTTSNNQTCMAVPIAEDALVLLDKLDKEADARINSGGGEVEAHLWNRAHLKALKLAGLVAVGCDYHNPRVTAPIAEWAIDFIRRDVEGMSAKFRDGDVGQGDAKLLADLRRVIMAWLRHKTNDQTEVTIQRDRCVTMRFLQQRTANLASFKGHRLGATNALREALKTMTDTGDLVEVPAANVWQRYKMRAKVFHLVG